jgi:hypothetical protein
MGLVHVVSPSTQWVEGLLLLCVRERVCFASHS